MASAQSVDSSLGRRMRLAARVSNAYGLALLLTLVTILVASMLPHENWARIIVIFLVGLTSVIGLASSNVSHPRLRLAVAVTGVAAISTVVAVALDSDAPMAFALLLTAGLLLVTGCTILARVLFAPTVTFRTILGALTTYTMLGMLYAFTYMVVAQVQPTPFFTQTGDTADGEFLFFSYTTLTTTGYGNLVPAGQPGESIAIFEMLTGQIFLVTLVAGLVSLWRPGRHLDDPVEDDERRPLRVGD